MDDALNVIDSLLDATPIPPMVKVKQYFERSRVTNIEIESRNKLQKKSVFSNMKKGQHIAIAVGSRGITNLPAILKTLIKALKEVGSVPFIIPAMGSHGGAAAEGQKKILENLGITEGFVGAPIISAMDVVKIGTLDSGLPVYLDKHASKADAVIIVNRIKPHVAFRGDYESGLMKMLAIGLGKQKGADACHNLGVGQMAATIPLIAQLIMEKTNIVFAVGIIENAYHETAKLEVLEKEEIASKEPQLLKEAKRLAPRLYFSNLDVLIIDEIGKDISGTGFDTNVVGRYHTPYASGGPSITRIAVLDLTDKSHGNANGLGIVDFTTKRVFDKFSFEQTYPNSLTSTVPLTVKIPMILKNDRQAIQAAIKTCNIPNKHEVRMVRIKNTLDLKEIEASENLIEEVGENNHLKIMSSPYELPFNEDGNLL